MSNKNAINDEIVLMRKAVRQSRVAVIRKLIKETKLLQARKHGDEKIREKCKRKADRLLAEITAIKRIKDDEISKFGIMEKRKLHEILNDLSTEPKNRIMARLVNHKILQDRIVKFKDKFPQYEDYLGPGRKKLSKLQRKAKREAKNTLEENKQDNKTLPNEKISKNDDVELSENSSDENEETNPSELPESENSNSEVENEETNDKPADNLSSNDDSNSERISRKKTKTTSKKKNEIIVNDVKSNDSIAEQSEKVSKAKNLKKVKKTLGQKNSAEAKKSKPIKVISEEATVKRFTDLLEDRESTEIVRQIDEAKNTKKNVIIEKQVDSFFMTGNDDSEYMSVVVPKPIICENDEQDERFSQNHAAKRQKTYHERNNKFFSKIDRPNDHGDKFVSHGDNRKANNYTRERDSTKKHSQVRNANSTDFEKKIDSKDEELHPSWAARKKQQEILKQGFQGKKIVFDD